jgi:hypothetical protein
MNRTPSICSWMDTKGSSVNVLSTLFNALLLLERERERGSEEEEVWVDVKMELLCLSLPAEEEEEEEEEGGFGWTSECVLGSSFSTESTNLLARFHHEEPPELLTSLFSPDCDILVDISARGGLS